MAYKIKSKKLTKKEKEVLKILKKVKGKMQTSTGRVPKNLTQKDVEKLQSYFGGKN